MNDLADGPRYNLMRQRIGAKGNATRRRIVDAAVELANVRTGHVPSITDICRTASVSKASFYQYFEDFGALVTELLEPEAEDIEALAAMLDQPWPAVDLYDRSFGFVAAYFDHWERYRVPLRLRHLMAAAGDKAMVDAQIRSLDPILRALARKLRDARGGGPARRDDHGLAIALNNAIIQGAMVVTHSLYPDAIDDAISRIHGDPGESQHRALAHLLAVTLSHPEVPRR